MNAITGTGKHYKVIMTTRPNAVDKILREKFGIMIENAGLDADGITEYLKKYFNNETDRSSIEMFLNTNPNIKL